MKPLLLLLCLLLSLAGAAPASAQEDAVRTLMHQGLERRYVLQRADQYRDAGAAPAGRRAARLAPAAAGDPRDWLPMEPVADREGFVVTYPDAIDGRWNYGARPDENIYDSWVFIDALVERLVARGIADPARIYVAGISRGALMTWTLLCRQPGRFAAAAALSSGMTEAHLASCTPSRLIPILAIAGTSDSVQPYDGSADPLRVPRDPLRVPRLLSIPRQWRSGNRRRRSPRTILGALPFLPPKPAERGSRHWAPRHVRASVGCSERRVLNFV